MDKLKLGIQWDINEEVLVKSMANTTRSLENTAQSVDELTSKINNNLVYLTDQTKTVQKYKSSLGDVASINSSDNLLQAGFASLTVADLAATEQSRQAELLKSQEESAMLMYTAEQVRLKELLALMMTYGQQRKGLLAKQKNEHIELLDESTSEEIAALDQLHKQAIAQLDASNIERIASYEDMFGDVASLAQGLAENVIANFELMLSGISDMPENVRTMIDKLISQAKNILRDSDAAVSIIADNEKAETTTSKLIAGAEKIKKAFDDLVKPVSEVNKELGTMFKIVSETFGAVKKIEDGISSLRDGISKIKSKEGGTENGGGVFGSVSSIAGVIPGASQVAGAVTAVVGGVVNLFKSSREAARKAAEEIKKYQDFVIVGELQYNRLLRERERSGKNLANMTLKELAVYRELLQAQLESKELREYTIQNPNASKSDIITGKNRVTVSAEMTDYEYALARLQNEGAHITGQRIVKSGGFLGIGRKTSVENITAGLAGKSYEELEKLFSTNKLDETGKKLFEELRKAKLESQEIAKKIKEIEEIAIADKMSGGLTASSLANPIIQGLRDGKRAFEDFAEFGENIVRDALLSSMAATVLEEPLKRLVEQFRKDSVDGLTAENIQDFQKKYKALVESGIQGMKDLEKVTGIDFGVKKVGGGMSGSIQSITQQQADVLAGQVGGIHLAIIRGQELSQKVYDVINSNATDFRQALVYWQSISISTEKTAGHTSRLEHIELWLEKIYSSGNNNSMRAGGN